jgi:hypothetical protein
MGLKWSLYDQKIEINAINPTKSRALDWEETKAWNPECADPHRFRPLDGTSII